MNQCLMPKKPSIARHCNQTPDKTQNINNGLANRYLQPHAYLGQALNKSTLIQMPTKRHKHSFEGPSYNPAADKSQHWARN